MDPNPRTFTPELLDRELAIVEENERLKAEREGPPAARPGHEQQSHGSGPRP